jgi:hypothetical protein
MDSPSNARQNAPSFGAIQEDEQLRLAWFGLEFKLHVKSASDVGAAPLKKTTA